MAAPQTAGTPTAPNVATQTPAAEATEAPDAASSGIAALLGDLTAEDAEPAAPVAAEGEEAPAEGETPEGEEPAEPADPTKGLDDDVIFADKSLETKEGVLRAKARIGQLRKLTHDKYVELKKYETRVVKRGEKLKHEVSEYVADKRTHRLLIDNVRASLEMTHSGDPERMVQGLANLYGMDGVKALELLNSTLINKGRPRMDPQIQQVIDGLRAEVEQLKGGLSEKQTQEQIQHLQHREHQHRQNIGARITQQAAQLPELSRIYADDPEGTIEHIVSTVTEAHAEFKAGRRAAPLDMNTYLVNLEGQLTKALNRGQAAQADGGGLAPKQPATAQRSPGKSIGPRSAAPSNPREPSEEESLRQLADDADLMSSLGLG